MLRSSCAICGDPGRMRNIPEIDEQGDDLIQKKRAENFFPAPLIATGFGVY
jgi:hypothetical protein